MATIIYHAPDSTMGDSSEAFCDLFRDYAERKLKQEFPGHEIIVSDSESTHQSFVDGAKADFELEELVANFCNELWTMADKDNIAFSLDLVDARSKLGLSQSKMADAMKVNVRTYQKWETGESQPTSGIWHLLDVMMWFHNNNRFDDYLRI